MAFSLCTLTLPNGDPAKQMLANFQTTYDAMSGTANAKAHTMLSNWGWKPTNYPSAHWRLFWRGIEAVQGL